MAGFLEEYAIGKEQDSHLHKSTFTISVLGAVLTAPFVLINFLHGRPGVGLAALSILSIYLFTAWRASKNRINYLRNAVLLTGALTAFFFISIYQQGIIGLLWSYPAVAALYVIFPMRLARVCNIVVFLIVVALAASFIDIAIAARAAITLLIVNTACIIFVSRTNQQQQDLSLLAETDALTGVFNRLKMNEKLNSMILEARVDGIAFTLIALDLDHFKKINDEKGHDVGDQVLRIFGRLLINSCRDTDLIFRTGGEEFIIAMLNADAVTSRKVASRIQQGLAKTEIAPDLKVTTSIGIATLQPHEILEELLKRCDDYLYQAKAAGRNCIIDNVQPVSSIAQA
ncbi:MAG: GGDEF domain-containing protein [Pseudomonadales bacterium]